MTSQSLLFSSVLPQLCDQLLYGDIVVMVLPSLLNIVQVSSADDYKRHIQPEMKQIYSMQRPVQVRARGA